MHRLLLLFLLSPLSGHSADLTPAQRAIVDGAVVYNAEMKAAPPLPADRVGNGWPYGVVLVFEGDTFLGSGSISHLGDGLMTTASHVVRAPSTIVPPQPRTYVAVHYDIDGNRSYVVTNRILVDDTKNDMALLKAPKEAARKWHSLRDMSLFHPTAEKIPLAEEVRIYGSSPLGQNRYLLAGKSGSRVVLEGTGTLTVLVDKRDGVLVPGNSGSIIVSKDGKTVEGIAARANGTHGEGAVLTSALGLSSRVGVCKVLVSLHGD